MRDVADSTRRVKVTALGRRVDNGAGRTPHANEKSLGPPIRSCPVVVGASIHGASSLCGPVPLKLTKRSRRTVRSSSPERQCPRRTDHGFDDNRGRPRDTTHNRARLMRSRRLRPERGSPETSSTEHSCRVWKSPSAQDDLHVHRGLVGLTIRSPPPIGDRVLLARDQSFQSSCFDTYFTIGGFSATRCHA